MIDVCAQVARHATLHSGNTCTCVQLLCVCTRVGTVPLQPQGVVPVVSGGFVSWVGGRCRSEGCLCP